MAVAIGIDVGTTGTRAVAVDEAGLIVGSSGHDYPLLTPRPQWTEQDPRDWWHATRSAIVELTSVVESGAVVGVGLTGQMHGSVFLDSSGEVVRPALLWNDQRTGLQCEWITERVGLQRLVEIAGNPALTGFQAPKIVWLRDNEPDAYQTVAHVLLPKDYVRYRLTGDLATDASDAAGTLLLDLRTRDWSPELCDLLGIDPAWLPRVLESPEISGSIGAAVAADLGLPAGTPVAAGAGDNAAAAVGTGITRPGLMSSSIGTSGVLFAYAAEPAIDPSGRIHAFCHAVPGAYCLLGVTLSAGGSLRWWRDVTGRDYDDLVGDAALVPPGAEGLVFLPYLTGERTPHLDPNARGAFVGLTARHSLAHMTRAVMEGVVFSLRDALEIMRGLGVDPREVRVTGGGGTVAMWRQLQADIYGLPLHRPETEEGAAYGAALLGHVAGGTFADLGEAESVVRMLPGATEPDPAAAARYDELYPVYAGLYTSLQTPMHTLSNQVGG